MGGLYVVAFGEEDGGYLNMSDVMLSKADMGVHETPRDAYELIESWCLLESPICAVLHS